MLIDNYELEIYTPPCDPGAERYVVRGRLTADISEVLPYLNATLHGAIYYAGAKALTWKNAGHSFAFHALEVAVSNIEDRNSAETELKEAVALVNNTWERRAEITPSTATRQRPTAMAVYKLLPRTNCKQCGEPTCFVFAGKLVVAQKKLTDCPPLVEAQYAQQHAALEAIGLEAP
jgi:ArsR family metal-binding transcriptional regulator